MCPADLKPYERAYKLELQERDKIVHRSCREYIISAVFYAIEHNFSKNPMSKYPDKPMLADIFEEEEEEQLDPDEIARREIEKEIMIEEQHMIRARKNGLKPTL